jgi:hypothetical protein
MLRETSELNAQKHVKVSASEKSSWAECSMMLLLLLMLSADFVVVAAA